MDKAIFKCFNETKVGDSEFKIHINIIKNLFELGCIPDNSSKTHVGKIMKEVHKEPRLNKYINYGDLIRTDFSASYKGSLGNISRMAVVGKPNITQVDNYNKLCFIHKKTIDFVKPGKKA